MGRRRCLRILCILGSGLLSGVGFPVQSEAKVKKSRVVLIKTENRRQGIEQAMAEFDLSSYAGKKIALKANYNSSDPFPASTHPEALQTVLEVLGNASCGPIVLAERSGMGTTRAVLEDLGVFRICEEHGVEVVVMETLKEADYIQFQPEASHWRRGFLLALPFSWADKVVQICCLKTHQFGGDFTMSLKNGVGAIAKYDPADGYNYMQELHGSPKQRTLVAEISQAFHSDIIIMDGTKAFVTGGPHTGREVAPGVIVAGTDPVAVDAVGVAILRLYGTTPAVSRGKIFEQEQIRRAAELGIGIASAAQIELVPKGAGSQDFADKIRKIMMEG
ncbi:DUF362 domain-containing protein [Pseudodesulfovibrio piezophilus]|nr:DUF362 domain-containing protein [Pseudodesulfovibrio piezophilus]